MKNRHNLTFSDKFWKELERRSKENNMSVSQYIEYTLGRLWGWYVDASIRV
jgi:hypothetical protein